MNSIKQQNDLNSLLTAGVFIFVFISSDNKDVVFPRIILKKEVHTHIKEKTLTTSAVTPLILTGVNSLFDITVMIKPGDVGKQEPEDYVFRCFGLLNKSC